MVTQPLNYPSPHSFYAKSAASTPNSNSGSDSSTDSTGIDGSAPSEQVFLQLLVAQIKNQDPTSPSDPSQFVAELAQFSQLEQVIAIRQDVDSINTSTAAPTSGSNSNA